MRILLSGASGFIGASLFSFLQSKGHTVVALVRRASTSGSIGWDPERGLIDETLLEGFDGVIHLAGENIASYWTPLKKRRILKSRVDTTFLLSNALSRLTRPPKVFISASAVGFYGDRGEEVLTEESHGGRGFLAHVCSEWELASRAVWERGVRTAQVRFGVVIGQGGMVHKLRRIYKWGLGGKLGSGEQWVSWIALSDLVRGIEFILLNESIDGPVNFVSPAPVRQRDFAEKFAAVLGKKAGLSQPAWLVRFLFGQMGKEVILFSQRAEPEKLAHAGFRFECPLLDRALQKAVERIESDPNRGFL